MKAADEIRPELVLWVLAGLVLAMLPHSLRFSPWMMVCFASLAAWRLLAALGQLPLPDRDHVSLWLLKHALAISAFLTIYISHHGQLDRDAGVSLLTALLGLKLIEMQTPRDFYVVAVLGYFLIVTNFFYSQTMAIAGYMLVVVVVVTAALIRANVRPAVLGTVACLRSAATMTLQALPLMAAAFVLFPRIPGPLWGLPDDGRAAVTGLSEVMTIGHITRLSLSDDVAFRAAFDGPLPPPLERYWRGPVLWHTDGTTWRAGTIGDGHTRAVIRSGKPFSYTVTLEPHGKRWLYGLEMVTFTGARARSTSDYRLLARNPVKQRLRYSLVSYTRYTLEQITAEERVAALALPAGKHPRAQQLARSWRETAQTDEQLVQQASSYFNREPFRYTLAPAPLLHDSVDEFLFETREGFCEHYAAAFVVLMRAAGIPARVVTGYQGGELNTVGGYFVVRQRDAHAWAEVYLAASGWTRLDPTAMVAPERVARGLGELLSNRNVLPILGDNAAAAAFWNRLRDTWDAVSYGWAQWVLGYTPQRQRHLLDSSGLTDWDHGTLVTALTLSLAVLTSLIGWFVIREKRDAGDPVVRAYGRFCAKLARVGLVRRASEGPADFARRVAASREDLAADANAITRLYIEIRYAGRTVDAAVLARSVRNFAPAARR